MTKEYPNIQRDLFMNLRWWTHWLQSNIYMQMQVFVSSWLHCGCCYCCCCLAQLQCAWIASPRDSQGGVDARALIWCCEDSWRDSQSLKAHSYHPDWVYRWSRNQCIPSYCVPVTRRAGEKQKRQSVTIWVHCCSYSYQQSLLEAFIDWFNVWPPGISRAK